MKNLKTFEQFHGSHTEPEIIKDGDIKIANYTGVLVKKNSKGNWAVFPNEGDKIFAILNNNKGFSIAELFQMDIVEINKELNVIICNHNGIETPVKFDLSDAGNRNTDDDKIAYFYVSQY